MVGPVELVVPRVGVVQDDWCCKVHYFGVLKPDAVISSSFSLLPLHYDYSVVGQLKRGQFPVNYIIVVVLL